MSLTNLEGLFKPNSVAVAGATNEPRNVGNIIIRHILAGKFLGPVMPLTPDEDQVLGLEAYASVDTLPVTPDLAILCVPPEMAPDYLFELGRRGVKAAVALCPGYARMAPKAKQAVQERMLAQARSQGIRMLGPSGLGLIIPSIGLNASLVPAEPPKGKIAFISQSASLFTAVLDWAKGNAVGFSHVVSLGDRVDLEYHDILDYLAADPNTRSILLYIESLNHARRFMSAARAAARTKPVLAVKPGRFSDPDAPQAADKGADEVYAEAFRRAGVLRVLEIDALFDAAQNLARGKSLTGGSLAILTNGGSLGVMCADTLLGLGGKLARLSDETRQTLVDTLGPNWDRDGVVDMGCTARVKHYQGALAALLKDKSPGAILVIHVPFATVPGEEVAQAVVQLASKTARPVLTCWMGHSAAEASRALFNKAATPTFDTPEQAVRAYMHMVRHRRTQELLMEMPAELPAGLDPDTEAVAGVVQSVLEEGRQELTEPEAKVVLAAYGVPVIRSLVVQGLEQAVEAAGQLGYPVALKVSSPLIPKPMDVGGVILDVEDQAELEHAVATLAARAEKLGVAGLNRFVVQRMGRRSAQELFLQAQVDPVFGPYLRFGQGGVAAHFSKDKAVGLPPLNMSLARDLVCRTRVAAQLKGMGGRPAADMDGLCRVILAVAQLVTDIGQIEEVEINPLLADGQGVAALNARIKVAPGDVHGPERLAIRPYPKELEQHTVLENGREVLLRPIRSEDERAHHEFFKHLSPEDQRLRFFSVVREFSHSEMAKLTQIDYEREMAFIATAHGQDGQPETLGVVRTSAKADNSSAEYAIIIRSDMQGIGIGRALTDKIVRYCKARGIKTLTGHILIENKNMQALARKVGFDLHRDDDEGTYEMFMDLTQRPD